MNKLQLNLNQNTTPFNQENEFENVVCNMSTILFPPQRVNAILIESHDL